MRFTITITLLAFAIALAAQTATDGFVVPPDTSGIVQGETYSSDENAKKPRMFSGRPGRAALYSLVIPGAGQIYNKRYWKAPIVWGAVGGMGYATYFTATEYFDYSERYKIALEEGSDPQGQYTTEQLKLLRDQWNKYRQLSIFGFVLVWVANSLEAYTDAHLKEFDIDEDLSLRINSPEYDFVSGAAQIGVTIRF